MHLQDINNLLNLQDINIVSISKTANNTVEITVENQSAIPSCPCCGSGHVIKRGVSGYRKVRHLPVFGLKTILLLPCMRFSYKDCFLSFTMQYSFVNGKSRYTNQYKEQIADAVVGSTVTNAARDCCINIIQATNVFDKWLEYGYSIKIPEVDKALKTFKNWKQEIINYHSCRYTNAAVEGRNNKIKALQRRGYFNRNPKSYKSKNYCRV
ncbi:MAG: transposase [Clostridiaceae bacterium]